MVLRENIIKTSSMKPDDKIIKNISGDCLSIQVDGGAELTLSGKHVTSSDEYDLGVVNMTTLSKQSSITGPGVYLCIITGIDVINLNISGSGEIRWKEIGD